MLTETRQAYAEKRYRRILKEVGIVQLMLDIFGQLDSLECYKSRLLEDIDDIFPEEKPELRQYRFRARGAVLRLK